MIECRQAYIIIKHPYCAFVTCSASSGEAGSAIQTCKTHCRADFEIGETQRRLADAQRGAQTNGDHSPPSSQTGQVKA